MQRHVAAALSLGLALVLAVVSACAGAREVSAASRAPVRYHLSIPDPASQYAQVRVVVPRTPGKHLDMAMPAWTPGSYLIRDFARHVHDLKAVADDGRTLSTRKLDKQTWRVEHGGRSFTLTYRVFCDELSVRTSHIDDRAAYLNGTSLFVYPPTHRDRPVQLTVEPPAQWAVHVALPSGSAATAPTFDAADYDALVDAPLMLGQFETQAFSVDGTRFEYVLDGAPTGGADTDRLVSDARKVVTAYGELMGGFPMQRYVFLASINDEGGGGLEHANSTMMMMRRGAFGTDRGYDRAARLVAHEFFHLWNVKRLRDAALRPYDYARENHTRLLWFHEGFTETAESLAMLRSGLTKPDDHVRSLGRRWTKYLRRPGRNARPISEVSFDAWTRRYKTAADTPNVSVSYYEKGDLIGVMLDLVIRRRSRTHGGDSDLFDVFRRLAKTHANRGLTMKDIVNATTAEAGEDMGWFFETYVTGREELKLVPLMEAFGVEVTAHAPWTKPDGTQLSAPQAALARTFSGIEWSGTTVHNVLPDSPASRAGLVRDDEVVAIEGRRVNSKSDARAALARLGPSRTAKLHLFRDGALRQIDVKLVETPHREYRFRLVEDGKLSDEQRELRKGWLGL